MDRDTLIRRVREEGTPLIDGNIATFVWDGETAPAVIGDFNGWGYRGPLGFEPLGGDLWIASIELPIDAYVEYALASDGGRILDPLNPRVASDGMGNSNNYFTMPAWQESRFAVTPRGTPRGRLKRYVVEGGNFVVGGKRAVHLYTPAVPGPYPLLVVLDGREYLRRARLVQIANSMIAQGAMQPVAMAFVEHAGPARVVEYFCSEATVRFIADRVLGLARQEIDLIDPAEYPGTYGIAGSSMGGLMALYAGMRLPDIFGRVVSQSGAFGLEVHGRASIIHELVAETPRRPLRIWMDVGKLEWLIDANRRMAALLRDRGYDVTYREHGGGHNYASWRNEIPGALEALFTPAQETVLTA